jgi:NAD(P)-dependent dehydrogenase (short-subunit alcohol dehydrogenase family)
MTERVVVITGATGATGKAAAHAFAERGDPLVLFGRDQARLDALRNELNVSDDCILARAVDLTDAQALQSAAQEVEKKFGGAHILIHLVGGWTGGRTLPETDPEDLASMLEQHVETTFNLFQAFAPQLERAGWGRALTVSTTAASRPVAKRGVYAAAKAAEEVLFLTLAEELKDKGVTANIILVHSIDAGDTGKGATPEEIVAAMLYLCSDEASRVNGARLPLG